MIRHWVYFTWVGIVALYGMEATYDYLLTFTIVNTYYTLGEYVFHRYTFHAPETFPVITRLHAKHHQIPTHTNRLFIPIHITLFNDILLLGLVYMMNGVIRKWLSAAHLSYLLFEYAHYGAHTPTIPYLPARLTAFHRYHHMVDTCHYAFTTPYWDIIFGTTRPSEQFHIKDYPLSWLPISIISFVSIYELQIITNMVYLWPFLGAWYHEWYGASVLYLSTGIISAIHHIHHGRHPSWKIADYSVASLYFVVSVWIWYSTVYLSSYIVILSCALSFILFLLDRQQKTCGLIHILWHLVTGVGVGYMISIVPLST